MAAPTSTPPDKNDNLAKEVMRRNDAMKSERSTWDTIWQQLSDYIQPRKSNIQVKTSTPDVNTNVDLYDTTAIDANLMLGAGQLQYITPASERWAGFDAPESVQNKPGGVPDDYAKWLEQCSEIVLREIARSNFYTEVHEFYLDRGGMGTACLSVMEGKRSTFNFTCLPIGSYCIAEDDEGYVDTLFREFKLTVRQAVQQFGVDALGPKVKKAYTDSKQSRMDEKHTYIHAVYPRADSDRDAKKIDGPNKAVASVYVCVEDKCVISNQGFDEMPYMSTRYLTWGEHVYGYCPSIDVIATIRQVNFIERQMDALAETTAFPRMLIPDSMAGSVDLAAGGVTIFDPNQPSALPKEWMTQGRYDVGQERVKTKQEAIRKAFHNDLFNMLANRTEQKTAYETMQLVAEKLVLFSPTFARLTTEFLNPLLQRLFGICFRNGMFSPPPASAFIANHAGVSLIAPQVIYTSKVALAIRALENHSFVEFMGIIGPLVNLSPQILDNFDTDKIVRAIARNLGLPTSWQVDEDAVAQKRDAAAKAQQAQAAIGAAQGVAKAGADLGKAPPAMQEQASALFSNPLTPAAGAPVK